MSIDAVNIPVMAESKPSSSGASAARSRLMGLLVMAVILGPMVAAYAVYKSGFGIPLGTINKGDLLPQAESILPLPLQTVEGEPLDILDGQKQWRLLLPAPLNCDDVCLQNLYTTRQVHIRLGEKARRVERVLLLQNTAQAVLMNDVLGDDHPRLKIAIADSEKLQALLASETIANREIYQRYYLMDQEGFIMMGYGAEHTGNELLKDIKRMLKYSYAER